MEKLFEQLKGYLKMDNEIPFQEFYNYYQEVLDCYIKDFQKFDKDALIKAKYIASIVNANAVARAKRKGDNTKKYKKIAEKMDFWAGAINYHLLEKGMTQQQIDSAEEELSASI